jgi:hypothetical protein
MQRKFLLLLLTLLLCTTIVFAQQDSSLNAPVDTEIIRLKGTIYVRKGMTKPYFKVNYDYTALEKNKSKPTVVKTDQMIKMVPVGDLPKRYSIQPPHNNLSRYFADSIRYEYLASDTPRVDTVRFLVHINKLGTMTNCMVPEETDETTSNKKLATEMVLLMGKYQSWPRNYKKWVPGGLVRTKRLTQGKKFYKKDFSCLMTVVAASFPLTQAQKNVGIRYVMEDDVAKVQ